MAIRPSGVTKIRKPATIHHQSIGRTQGTSDSVAAMLLAIASHTTHCIPVSAASGVLDRPNVKVGGTVVQDLTREVIPGLINALKGKKKAPAQ